MLGADVVVSELQCFAQRQLENLLGPRRERDVPARRLLPLPNDLFDLLADSLERDSEGLHGFCSHAFALVDQPEQYVLSADVVVVEHPGFFLGQDDNTTGAVGKPFEHLAHSPYRGRRGSVDSACS